MPLDTPQPPRIKRGEAHTVHTRGLTLLRSGHREIRKLKRANHVPTIHGNKVWNSSFLIMDQLTREKGPLRLTADTGIDAICHAMEARGPEIDARLTRG